MEDDDTVSGGESLSIEEAASAFVKSSTKEAETSQPEDTEQDQGEEADDELHESDEEEGESEGEDDPTGQSDEDEDEEPETDSGRFVAANGKVRLPDGTVSTVSDLIAGNMKERDYRQKTMELAPQRRALEEQSSAIKASEQQLNVQREYLSKLLESITPPPPDPGMAADPSDPVAYIEYMRLKEQHDNYAAHAQYIQQQLGLSKQQAEQETAKQKQARADEEWGKLQEKVPALRDQAKLKSLVNDVLSAAQAVGFSPQEINETVPYDHRYSLILQKAAKWDKLQASKPKVGEKVQGRPPVQRSGKQVSRDAKRMQRTNDAVNRLRQTGTVEDATAAYLASLNKG